MKKIKTVQEMAMLELGKNARILQRQLKIMRGLRLSDREREIAREIIASLEKEFQDFRV